MEDDQAVDVSAFVRESMVIWHFRASVSKPGYQGAPK